MTKPVKTVKPVAIKPVLPLPKKITKAALDALRGKVSGITKDWNFCLQFARRVIETALGLPDRGFYSLVTGVDSNPSAKELESLLRQQRPNWVVQTAQEGDLVFWNNLPPQWGHIGVVILFEGKLWVAQNTTVTKLGIDFGGALQLIPLEQHQTPTSIIRIAKV
jgi:hypothetical protein